MGKIYEDPEEIRDRMEKKGFWPLYEGKHIEQFLIDTKPIERWVCLETVKKLGQSLPPAESKLVYRDIACNTNMRTAICALLPEKSCFGHTLAGVKISDSEKVRFSSLFNSFIFDFVLRIRMAGTHLSYNYLKRMPVIDKKLKAIVKTHSASYGKITHIAEIKTLWPQLWQMNREVVEAYGLGPDDFSHILSTFPVFARKRPEFFAYLQERLREWKNE